MTFLAAGWLALLLPWAALLAWLWRRQADERHATATFLWRRDPLEPVARRAARRRPPAWMIAGLASLLAAVIALAEPSVRHRSVRLRVVVDGSIALAANVGGKSLRDALLDELQGRIDASAYDVVVDVCVAGLHRGEHLTLGEARSARFTARPTQDALAEAVAEAMEGGEVVAVLTDQHIARADARLAVLTPREPRDNVGIESAIAVERPRPSVMVRVANDSDRPGALLEVRSGTWRHRQSVALPRRGESSNIFVDLPTPPGDEIDVAIVELDDMLTIDDAATLLRTGGRAQLEVDAGLPEVAQRFAAAYERARGGTAAAETRITLSTAPRDRLPGPQLVLAGDLSIEAGGAVRLSDHPILRELDFTSLAIRRVAAPPAGDDWKTIAWGGEAPVICVREGAARAAWIGVELDPLDVQSVVLLSNAVDWLSGGGGATEWRGGRPDSIGQDWRAIEMKDVLIDAAPGRYKDAAGRTVAVNVPAVIRPAAQPRGDVVALLDQAARNEQRSLRRPVIVVAASLGLLAALLASSPAARNRES